VAAGASAPAGSGRCGVSAHRRAGGRAQGSAMCWIRLAPALRGPGPAGGGPARTGVEDLLSSCAMAPPVVCSTTPRLLRAGGGGQRGFRAAAALEALACWRVVFKAASTMPWLTVSIPSCSPSDRLRGHRSRSWSGIEAAVADPAAWLRSRRGEKPCLKTCRSEPCCAGSGSGLDGAIRCPPLEPASSGSGLGPLRSTTGVGDCG